MSRGRGALIVLEGCDRAGKSTQCRKIVRSLLERNIPAQMLSFPDRSTHTGKIIDSYLSKKEDISDKAIHLLFSANRWELEPRIVQSLDSGITLIVDRYSYSGVAFSVAKQGMNFDWCSRPEEGLPKPDLVFFLNLSPEAITNRGGFGEERYENSDFQQKGMNFDWCSRPEEGLPKPDLVFFLNLSPEAITNRGGFGEERYENSDFQQKVMNNFHSLFDHSWTTVNADQSEESLHNELMKFVLQTVEEIGCKPLSKLW